MEKGFIDLLNSLDNKNYMYNFITYLISPVITGIKPSSTITLAKEGRNLYDLWNKNGYKFLKNLNLDFITLRENNTSKIILVYNKDNLKKVIYNKQNLNFLRKLDYNTHMNFEDMLTHLKFRYNKIHCPHELGIFLGIPLKDVEAFMDCSSEKCIMCRYWKVYKEKEKAEKIFEYYDKSKQTIMNYLISGTSIKNVKHLTYNIYNSIQA